MMGRSSGERIAIIGGGIGGLCLAAALKRMAIPWALWERARALEPKGTGIALMPPALRVLDLLGLTDQVHQVSVPVPGTRRFRSDGKLLFDVPYPDVWGGSGCRSIHRADLQTVLLAAAKGGGDVVLNKPARSVSTAGSRATVHFEDESLTSALVVGADGVNSIARNAMGDMKVRLLRQKIFRAHTPATGLVDRHTLYLGRQAALGAVPLTNGTYLFVNQFNCDDERAGPELGRRSRVLSVLEDLTAPGAMALLSEFPSDTSIHEDATFEVPASAYGWSCGRLALLGDAAHAMSPVLAVGAAMAMEDAWVLAEEMSRTGDIDAALASYAARRGPRVQWVQTASADVTRRAQTGQRAPDLAEELRAAYLPLCTPP